MKRQPEPIITTAGQEIILDMNMDGRDFAQARLLPFLEESGYVAVPAGADDTEQTTFRFSPWTFRETVEKDGWIQVTGTAPAGTALLEILSAENPAEPETVRSAEDAVIRVCSAIESAVSQGISLPHTGPAGTILLPDGKILFLPETLFTRAAEARQQTEYSALLGCWIHPGLNDMESLLFTEAVYVYRYLTRQLPYPVLYTERRQEDYYDRNFIPVQFMVPEIPEQLAETINGNLGRRGAVRANGRTAASARTRKNSVPCRPVPVTLIKTIPVPQEQSPDVTKKREQFIREQQKRIKRIRFVRKHNTTLKVTGIVFGAVCAIILYSLSDRQNNYIPTGLTSREVCEALYSGMHRMDIAMMQAVCKGSGTSSLLDTMSGFYVTSKVRQSMEPNTATVTPAEWLYLPETSYQIFGLTQLYLDGTSASLYTVPHIRRDKPEPVTTESGRLLQDGDTTTVNAEYYFIHYDGIDSAAVETCNDTVTLEYRKNSWYITGIDHTSRYESFNTADFAAVVDKAVTDAGGSIVLAATRLSAAYPWLPAETDILADGAVPVYRQLQLPAAADDLLDAGLLQPSGQAAP